MRGYYKPTFRDTIRVTIRDTLRDAPVVEVSGPPTNPLLILQRIPAREGLRFRVQGYYKGCDNMSATTRDTKTDSIRDTTSHTIRVTVSDTI